MLASQGFPLYGHSPPSGFLADYAPPQPCRAYGYRPPLTRRATTPLAGPRPCLRPGPPAGTKKKVVFADDHGLSLTQVRVMREPSDQPPSWSLRPSSPIQQCVVQKSSWELNFAQPASDYVDFRRRINDDKVSLENVIIKEKDGFLTGTIKVKNIHFQKEVIVRWSADSWVTSEDAFCVYVDVQTAMAGTYSLYDTFTFRIQLPVTSRRLDFCVCYRCNNEEFWDSNSGDNYSVVKRDNTVMAAISAAPVARAPSPVSKTLWSEYASWNGPCDVPYW